MICKATITYKVTNFEPAPGSCTINKKLEKTCLNLFNKYIDLLIN